MIFPSFSISTNLCINCRLPQWLRSKESPLMQETQEKQFQFLGWENPLEVLALRIPWLRSLVGYSP